MGWSGISSQQVKWKYMSPPTTKPELHLINVLAWSPALWLVWIRLILVEYQGKGISVPPSIYRLVWRYHRHWQPFVLAFHGNIHSIILGMILGGAIRFARGLPAYFPEYWKSWKVFGDLKICLKTALFCPFSTDSDDQDLKRASLKLCRISIYYAFINFLLNWTNVLISDGEGWWGGFYTTDDKMFRVIETTRQRHW